jgi:transcriptional regulator with XRE-family HTH domain
VTKTEPGIVLRLAREAAGLSLEAMARRTYFSKGHLANIETGKRTATPTVIRAYQDALGDDVNRRQLLMTLLAGAVTPSASAVEAVGRAFEFALDAPPLTVDDWLAKLDAYGHEYMLVGAGDLQARLAADLARLQTGLDHPVLAAVAAKLLTLQGIAIQCNAMPSADGRRRDAVRWYLLGARAADRSDSTDVRAWVRGRAAFALAYEGAELSVAQSFASQALALSKRPSLSRLNALLALANTQGLDGDRTGALATFNDAKRTLDAIGFENRISDFAGPEWLIASTTSLLASRIGEERIALDAQETAERTRPAALSRFSPHIRLHWALMMAKSGGREEGIAYAQGVLAELPPERHDIALRLRMSEIETPSPRPGIRR